MTEVSTETFYRGMCFLCQNLTMSESPNRYGFYSQDELVGYYDRVKDKHYLKSKVITGLAEE